AAPRPQPREPDTDGVVQARRRCRWGRPCRLRRPRLLLEVRGLPAVHHVSLVVALRYLICSSQDLILASRAAWSWSCSASAGPTLCIVIARIALRIRTTIAT